MAMAIEIHHRRKTSSVVCKFWLAGMCNRNPCYFAHQSPPQIQKQPWSSCVSGVGPVTRNHRTAEGYDEDRRVCTYWMSGTCIHAEKCRFLHSWVSNKAKMDIERVTEIKKHRKAITGIALPSGSQLMYTGSKDGTLRSREISTGCCTGFINVGGEVGCVICEGSWVFAGVQNAIWAWNIDGTSNRLFLEEPVGLVHALVFCHEILFAACEDGNILAYKHTPEEMPFTQIATLRGHDNAVLSLSASFDKIYSGSTDGQVRVWDADTLRCTHILEGHSGAVTSLISWDAFLISGSLDETFKIWAGTEDGDIEEVHTHYVEQGVITFMGMTDADKNPVLFVSCNDNSIRLYELSPGVPDRGRLFTEDRATTITWGGRHFFTGDASGNLHAWKWLGQPSS